ncbi:transposase (plasmid) [Kitasatospora sp. NBC_00070]|uniref:transposase family protein n=1 Tax=Kitasatospora sp. NBC_00070 TaxID=2975962 RepID=UPI0032493C7F
MYKSVVMVLFLLRQNPVQQAAAELFGCSQSTVSRRLALLGPLLEQVLAGFVPDPAEATAGRAVLVDGTLVTTWDWACQGTELFSGKLRDTGFNLQIAATLDGDLLAVSAPMPGSWHDAHAWRESGLPETLADRDIVGDLGYLGLGLLTGHRKPPGRPLPEAHKAFNRDLSALRSAVERAIAHLKDWKIPATRYRGPLTAFPKIVKTVTALAFFRMAW